MKERWNALEQGERLKFGYLLIVILAVCILWSYLSAKTEVLEKKRLGRELALKEIMPLAAVYKSVKQSSDQFSTRVGGAKSDESPGKIIEEIGIKGKSVRVVPVKGEERQGFIEDAADVKIEGLSSNELVNLLYRLEKGTRPVIIRKGSVKGRLDDPAKLDLTMTMAVVKPASGQKQP